MKDEKPNKYDQHDSLPIPTYDEAIDSRTSSSQSFLGAEHVNNDAERQGLLGRRDCQQDAYQDPAVESTRSSLDFLPASGEVSRRGSTYGFRRGLSQMEVLEPDTDGRSRRFEGIRFSKRITSLTHSLSGLRIRQWLPSWDFIAAKTPSLKPNWIMMSRFFALLLVLSLAYLLFLSDLFKTGNRPGVRWFDAEAIRDYMRDNINETNIREHLRYITSFDHMAGTKGDFVLAEYIYNNFAESKLEDVSMERFDVYINFPKDGGRKVAIIDPPELAWEAIIEEDLAYSNPPRNQVPVFHGLSRSGNVTGPLIVSQILLIRPRGMADYYSVCELWIEGGF